MAQVPCINGSAGGYACANVDLMAVLGPAGLGVPGGNASINDLWGWVDPVTGAEYALVGCLNGTAFVDVSTPTGPVLIGNLPTHTTNSIWRDIKVYADHAFIVSEASGHGLQVFDLTRLRNVLTPPVTFTEDAHSGLFGNAHNIAIDEVAGMAYVVGSNQCSGGLYMFDVSIPTSPQLAGCYALDGYIHDAQCVTYSGPDADHQGKRICFNSHSGNPDKKSIVDVTDPTDPERLAVVNWPNARIGHQGWLTEDQRFFLMGDEGDEVSFGFNTRTLVFDVLDLDAPVLVGSHFGTQASTDHNLYTHQGLIHQANYSSGLQILRPVDLSSAQMQEIAWFDTYPPGSSAGYDGAWSVYPYLPSGHVLVSDFDNGLFILRPRVQLQLKVLLSGAFDEVSGLMQDSLRSKGLLPLQEPYSASGSIFVGGGGEVIDPSVLSVTGQDAIVDWLVIELRDPDTPSVVRASRTALLQRDGDVVDVDGTTLPTLGAAPTAYHIAIRHRNHLGIMTAQAVDVGPVPFELDLTDGSVPLSGAEPTLVLGSRHLMWSGNAIGDTALKYTGQDNDRDAILQVIGGVVPSATVTGYLNADVNLDGRVKYVGVSNDRDPVLLHVGGSVPTAVRQEQLP
ncbi:MAG: choice-of-anchor B family protein [Flavobacteriales bacterium]|nr:choice-of-anchor B family protein [Flavobacteriales bacterium]